MLRLAQNQPMTRPRSARSLRPKHYLSQTVASAVSLRSQVVSKLSSWECCIQPNATYATAWLDHPSWRAGACSGGHASLLLRSFFGRQLEIPCRHSIKLPTGHLGHKPPFLVIHFTMRQYRANRMYMCFICSLFKKNNANAFWLTNPKNLKTKFNKALKWQVRCIRSSQLLSTFDKPAQEKGQVCKSSHERRSNQRFKPSWSYNSPAKHHGRKLGEIVDAMWWIILGGPEWHCP